MKKIILISGLPGTGTSNYINNNYEGYHSVSIGSNDVLNAKKIANCFARYLSALELKKDKIVVNAPLFSREEINPYMVAAQSFNYGAEIISFCCRTIDEVKTACANSRPAVPMEYCLLQHKKMLSRELPSWWKNTNIYPFKVGDGK